MELVSWHVPRANLPAAHSKDFKAFSFSKGFSNIHERHTNAKKTSYNFLKTSLSNCLGTSACIYSLFPKSLKDNVSQGFLNRVQTPYKRIRNVSKLPQNALRTSYERSLHVRFVNVRIV